MKIFAQNANHKSVLESFYQLEQQALLLPQPMGELLLQKYGPNPYIMLVACILSLRARDRVVYPIVQKLILQIDSFEQLLKANQSHLEKLLKPIGFYRVKAATLRKIASVIVNQYQGKIPLNREKLAALPGVGPKTTAFMLSHCTQEPALCVDTHVHRLSNLFGWVKTHTPQETEQALMHLFPPELWYRLTRTLVTWGQQVCTGRGLRRNQKLHDQFCPCLR